MQLPITTPLSDMVFEQPPSGVEGIAHADVGICMRMPGGRIAPDDNLAAWDIQVDPDMEQIALLMTLLLGFDNHMTGNDPVEKAFELFGTAADARSQRL
jgi:hypothetical protein